MDSKTLVAFHEKLVTAGKASCEFDDADQTTLHYLFKVLSELQDLKEIRSSLRQRVGGLEEQVGQLKSERKILRRTIVTAGLPDPFASGTETFAADDATKVNQTIEDNPHSKLPQVDFE